MMALLAKPARGVAGVFLAFAAGYFLSYLFRTVNGPIADELVRVFHLNARQLGLLTATYFLTFTLAQLPFGPLVDRYGPRRVQGVVLVIGAVGAVLFAVAQNTATLMLGRGLIGLGTSGALMAGLKAITLWLPAERRALANGGFVMFGGLGAMASTAPVNLLLPVLGWRGVFLLLAGATLACAVLVLVAVPEKPAVARPEDWRSNLRGMAEVYRSPAFWRLAPLSASVVGTAFAVHGLWAARWFAEVARLSPAAVVQNMLAMGGGLTLGAIVLGLVSDRLRRRGVAPALTFGCACTAFVALQVAAICGLALPVWLLWGVLGGFGGMTVLSYAMVGELFPAERIGRANACLNVLHLSMAFVVQYGMGVVAAHWPPDMSGHLPVIAYRAAFALPLVLELVALAWFVWRRRSFTRPAPKTRSPSRTRLSRKVFASFFKKTRFLLSFRRADQSADRPIPPGTASHNYTLRSARNTATILTARRIGTVYSGVPPRGASAAL